MAGRPIDHERRAQLLDAVVDHAVAHGFADLSWRPVAVSLGVAPSTLVHRFGTKDAMLEAILERLQQRIFAATREALGQQGSVAAAARIVWERTSDPRRASEFTLFFAVYGQSLQDRGRFGGFLDRVVADWLNSLIELQTPSVDRSTAAQQATLVIATIRGLLLDLLTTGDVDRVQSSAEYFLASLAH